ncbi:hypothetical protein OG455_27080 [Kitasatospora sp. NBC_01287]|uniref:hypothetical protein n=1 Tax=Kitasatospora sp. NBC_01287 TaxID=2903573 RepID=UPI0022556439|nr:hypothetical protein [Kitasatospora sp. NBC_01287]MCX4749130.1 hypothetical protein [Kitasatospora sp. NBC_01287]
MWKLSFVAGAAVGYVLGARAGRQRYERIAATARRVAEHPAVQDATRRAKDSAGSAASRAVGAVTGKVGEKLPDALSDRVPYLGRRRGEDDSWGTARP